MARPSTRAIGLAFEQHVQRFLNGDLRMSLEHVGGRGDGGVDLRGWWWLPRRPRRRRSKPSSSEDESSHSGDAESAWKPPRPPGLRRDGTPGPRIEALRVLAQCKAERDPQGPRVVRELEGTMGHVAAQEPRLPLVGVLASQSGYSLKAMEHATRCAAPMLLVHLEGGRPGDVTDDSSVASEGSLAPRVPVAALWWNAALGALLRSAGVELRRELGSDGATHVGVWAAGGRMGRYGPPI